jgi:hypothetical protein
MELTARRSFVICVCLISRRDSYPCQASLQLDSYSALWLLRATVAQVLAAFSLCEMTHRKNNYINITNGPELVMIWFKKESFQNYATCIR